MEFLLSFILNHILLMYKKLNWNKFFVMIRILWLWESFVSNLCKFSKIIGKDQTIDIWFSRHITNSLFHFCGKLRVIDDPNRSHQKLFKCWERSKFLNFSKITRSPEYLITFYISRVLTLIEFKVIKLTKKLLIFLNRNLSMLRASA